MPYNLLIFPLISGYFILNSFAYFTEKYKRVTDQRLLFHSVITGIIYYTALFFIRRTIEAIAPKVIPAIFEWLEVFPIPHQTLLWTSASGFVIVVVTIPILNWCINQFSETKLFVNLNLKTPVEQAVDRYGSELEQLFKASFLDSQLLQISLTNRKVYIGYANQILPPKESQYVRIIPVISGYRHNDTNKLIFTTDYSYALDNFADNMTECGYGLDIIIKKNEIISANIFDPEVYDSFQQEQYVGEPEGITYKSKD